MVFGDASTWFVGLRDVHEEVVAVILHVWPHVASKFTAASKEDKITDRLVVEIRRHIDGRHKWLVQREHQLLPVDEKGEIKEKPRIDIAVFFTREQKVYIAYECKRLHVRFPSGFSDLADRYVNDGMMRFLSGKYAPGLLFGVVLGYVMDSNVLGALQNVRNAIHKRETQLRCNKIIEELPDAGAMKRMCTSHNIKKLGPLPFTMQHGFLPLVVS